MTRPFIMWSLLLLFATPLLAEDYLIQAGDQITVFLPGEASLTDPITVDRQGRLLLPEAGPIPVAGLSEAQLKQEVVDQLGQMFRDLDNLRVYLFKKQMLIRVQGYVHNPGEFTLPADATVQMALHAAGGIRNGAQLNQLSRVRDQVSLLFDYKKYLDSGDLNHLPALQSLDRLFVPASPMTGNVEIEFDPATIADSGDAAANRLAIKVFGEVNSPGSFSFRTSMSLVDLLMRAGGVTRYASVEQIRVISAGKPTLFNLTHYLDSGDEELLPPILAGATVFVPQQEEQIKSGANTVYVMGEVAHPGAFEGQGNATFMDILANAGGPTRYAESRQIRLIKANGEVVKFDLAAYTEGTLESQPPTISPGDAIFVPEKSDMNEKSWLMVAPDRAVRVIGEVVRPGRIEWSNEMSLLDLLAHVGGPTSRADTSSIEVVTPITENRSKTTLFDLDAFIKSGASDLQLPEIRAGSTVRIHDLPRDPANNKSQWVRQASEKSIYVFGQVGAPGRYMFTNAMHFLDILAAADGPTGSADIHNIRVTHRDGDQAQVSKLNLALYFETGDEQLLPNVRTGDTVYVPEKNRIWLDQPKEKMVRVLGAINRPGRYRFDDSMTLLDLLAEAGGPTTNAYAQKITVINLSCCRDQARSFDLLSFSRNADFTALPVLRAGDTVYVPDRRESNIAKIRVGLRDVFELFSLATMMGQL